MHVIVMYSHHPAYIDEDMFSAFYHVKTLRERFQGTLVSQTHTHTQWPLAHPPHTAGRRLGRVSTTQAGDESAS